MTIKRDSQGGLPLEPPEAPIPPKPREACGVLALALPPGAEGARRASWGLYALQHRGQESAGLVTSDANTLHRRVGMGWVHEVFGGESFDDLPGALVIGHTRYSTSGASDLAHAQPFQLGDLALAHNGHLINAAELAADLTDLTSTSDSEVILRWLAARIRAGLRPPEALAAFMAEARGAYALVLLTPDAAYGARDPWGFRPLVLGRMNPGGWAVASESCALEAMQSAALVREVRPGEILRLRHDGIESLQGRRAERPSLCSLEWIYFARPDSRLDGVRQVHSAREALGRQLAAEAPAAVDLVIGVPESALPAAQAYAAALGLPHRAGLVKNRYVGRTFIQPTARLRRAGVRLKYSALEEVVAGQRLALVDDSLVRGTTARPLIQLLRDAGAAEIHLRIAAPPVRHPCQMGVNMTRYDELAAHGRTVEALCASLGADSLAFLSLKGLEEALDTPGAPPSRCEACFTGDSIFG